jgi:hypothetical protein
MTTMTMMMAMSHHVISSQLGNLKPEMMLNNI